MSIPFAEGALVDPHSDMPVVPFFGLKRYSEDGASNWIIGYPMFAYEIGFGGL